MSTASRALVRALSEIAPRLSPEHRAGKVRLLDRLAATRIHDAGTLQRAHEILCFLQAYPDDREVLERADRVLAGFARRVERLGRRAVAGLRDTGIAGTTAVYRFGFPMARWLAARWPRDVDVAWREFRDGDRLDDVLALLVTHAEDDAFSEGGLGWRAWLRVAKAGRPTSDLAVLLDLFGAAGLPPAVRDWLFESAALPIRWRIRAAGSRTRARLPWSRPCFERPARIRDAGRFAAEARRPIGSLRRAPPALARTLIEASRIAMASRSRELYGFSHPNPEDVLVADPGFGLRVSLIGLHPEHRLPIEAYYAFFVLRNGVPVSYGGGWYLFGALEMGLNVFESFRQGDSAFIFSQVLRAYRAVFAVRTVIVDRYQIGYQNAEALRSGAYYFYDRLGFRPRDPGVARLAGAERARIARDGSYRSPPGVLRRLAQSEIALTLDGAQAGGWPVRSAEVAGLVTRAFAGWSAGDRRRAARAIPERVARVLGVRGRARWPVAERRAFARLAPAAALLPGLDRWRAEDRRRLAEAFRAKGARSEHRYARMLDRHARFRRDLSRAVALARVADTTRERVRSGGRAGASGLPHFPLLREA